MNEFKRYQKHVYDIIGAAMTVHKELGCGLSESIYQEALCMELAERGINAEAEAELNCFYKGKQMKKSYRMDVVVGDIIIELKAVDELCSDHRGQLFNYMRLTNKPIGLLINFGSSRLKGERYGFKGDTNECVLLDKNMEVVPREKRMVIVYD